MEFIYQHSVAIVALVCSVVSFTFGQALGWEKGFQAGRASGAQAMIGHDLRKHGD